MGLKLLVSGFLILINFVMMAGAVEVLKDTSVTSTSIWTFNERNGSHATLNRTSDYLSIDIKQSSSCSWTDLSLIQEFPIKANKVYSVTLDAASSVDQTVSIGLYRKNNIVWYKYVPMVTGPAELNNIRKKNTLSFDNFGGCAFSDTSSAFVLFFGTAKGVLRVYNISVDETDKPGSGDNAFSCPGTTHKCDITYKDKSSLPEGFYVYTHSVEDGEKSMYLSPIRQFEPKQIDHTQNDLPFSMTISTDGKWVLYGNGADNHAYMIKTNGNCKTRIPVDHFISTIGFYRNSPLGSEIYYDVTVHDTTRIYAMKYDVGNGGAITFSQKRVIANLQGKYVANSRMFLPIVKDKVFGEFSIPKNGKYYSKSSYLTIPDSGRGTAGPDNFYKFLNDTGGTIDGCNHALSPDGKYALALPGIIGSEGPYRGCSPEEHKGFYIMPFFYYNDTPLDFHTFFHRKSISINFADFRYRMTTAYEISYEGWSFGNNSKYVIGCQVGPVSPFKGLWMIDWETNSWFQLTHPDSSIETQKPDVYFGNYDLSPDDDSCSGIIDTSSGNPPDLQYGIVKPDGGELYEVGAQCTVVVQSKIPLDSYLLLVVGKYQFSLLKDDDTFDPYSNGTHIFTIPDSFETISFNGTEEVKKNISTVSSQCRIMVKPYTKTFPSTASEGYFSIVKKGNGVVGGIGRLGKAAPLHTKILSSQNFIAVPEHGCKRIEFYTIAGRLIGYADIGRSDKRKNIPTPGFLKTYSLHLVKYR